MTELSANRLRMDLTHLFRILIIMELIALAVSTAAASVVEVLIYIVFFSSARLRKKVGLTLKQPMVIMTLVLWAMVGIGIFYSAAPLSDAFELWGSWRKCLIVPLAAAAYDTTVWKDRFLWAFILLMALASLISFASFLGEFMLYAKLETPGIILNNHATQAMFFATAAFSCIIMFVHDKTCRRWIFSPLAALFMANLVIISWGRSGYLALMVYLVLLIFWETRGRLRLVLLVVIPVCTVTALMISPVSRNIIQKGFSEMQTYETDPVKTAMGLRMVFWKNTMAILEKNEHPFSDTAPTDSSRPTPQWWKAGQDGRESPLQTPITSICISWLNTGASGWQCSSCLFYPFSYRKHRPPITISESALSGPGLPPACSTAIFQPFMKGGSSLSGARSCWQR